MRTEQAILGAKIGLLTVTGLPFSKNKHAHVECTCECGSKKIVRIGHLGTEPRKTKSCGCLSGGVSGIYNKRYKHGDSKKTSEYHYLYVLFLAIKGRCYLTTSTSYDRYGARGIKLVFKDYEEFREYILSELGDRPSKEYSLDRIDNDGNYEKGNLRWATYTEQNNNRRVMVSMSKLEYANYLAFLKTQKASSE